MEVSLPMYALSAISEANAVWSRALARHAKMISADSDMAITAKLTQARQTDETCLHSIICTADG